MSETEMTHRYGMHDHTPHPKCRWLQLDPAWPSYLRVNMWALAGCRLLQLVSGHSLSPDMCLAVTVLEKEFTIQTLAAMALAVYTTIERRSKACAMEVKS